MSAQFRFISAGAGSGKTHRLTELLLAELKAGRVRPAGVLATTFTNRAATELRERVRAFLISQGEFARADAVGSARIGTVNSVCGSLLQRFAFEAGLPTDQRVLDEGRAGQLLREAIGTAVEAHTLTELLQVARRLSLDTDPRGGVEPWQDALRNLVDQARANAIDAESLRAFGKENADNLLSHFPPPQPDFDARLGAALAAAIPGVTQSLIATPQKNTGTYLDLLASAQRHLAQHTLPWSTWNKLTQPGPAKVKTFSEPVMDVASQLASHPGLHGDLRRYLELLFDLAADTLDAYANAKLRIGALDFTDQEHLLLGVLDHPFVASTLGEELELLMVDEFQDTSPIQLALFLKLARHAKQVVWVGDVKQAIYGFRGSDTALMRCVLEALPKLGGTKEVLAHSWRSRPVLVEFVNHVFANRFEGLAASEVTLLAKRTEVPGSVAVADWLLEGANAESRHNALATGIQRLLASGQQIVDPKSEQLRSVRAADIAVLVRANDTVVGVARALAAAGIPSATQQPGLLGEPEVVLALACIRRLNDDKDTLATAEVVALADCAEPETWLVDRLNWLAAGGAPGEWKESAKPGHDPHVILETLRTLREQAVVLTPKEAVELVIARCGLARRVVQWQRGVDRARVRLANLDRLIGLVQQYEDECLSARDPASISGLLLWLQDLAANELDTKQLPAVDAVQVMTHHAAKGLEWPVVVLCDLASDVRDRLWGIQAESLAAFDIDRPLARRFVRYWPWPFGQQKNVAATAAQAFEPVAQAAHDHAAAENKRLLYVSMTRARDLLVFARQTKRLTGEWMGTVALGELLPEEGETVIKLPGGIDVPFERWELAAEGLAHSSAEGERDLSWFDHIDKPMARPALKVNPSSLAGATARIVETVPIGRRIVTGKGDDRSRLGEAIHACIAADLATPAKSLDLPEVAAILKRMQAAEDVDAAALHQQLGALRSWLATRWPDAAPVVELPVAQLTAEGQHVQGRTDLVLRTATGWILMDHKTTPQGRDQWGDLANTHAGQLAAYRDVLLAASGLPVEEIWLVLPVAGAAVRVELAGDDDRNAADRFRVGLDDL
jgi:ATP-dependent helicase/nuclease subunit A